MLEVLDPTKDIYDHFEGIICTTHKAKYEINLPMTELEIAEDSLSGDLGIIEEINRIEQEIVDKFEGRQVEYDFGDLDELVLAQALLAGFRSAIMELGFLKLSCSESLSQS